jgi:GrpB-like predicted nucleotidyltransferase (UPF0157 family)
MAGSIRIGGESATRRNGQLVAAHRTCGLHFGPGLAAKPVIDIQISVATLDGLGVYVAPLASLGYSHVPFEDDDLVYPFFRKPAKWPSTHHIHLCMIGSEYERRHLAFRDYLRNHPQTANEYVALKRSLAAAPRRHNGGIA